MSEGTDEMIPEQDAAAMLKFMSDVAAMEGPMPAKRRTLMEGLAAFIGADAWSWIIARFADDHDAPAVGAFQCGGLDDVQMVRYAQIMQDRDYLPVEYAALNKLRRTQAHFTRRWDELVTPEQWYGPANRHVVDGIGFEHFLYSIRVLDEDGYFSRIVLKRKKGQPNFGSRERRLTHLVTGIVNWLHWDPKLAVMTKEVRPLPSHLRTTLMLLVDPRIPLLDIGARLGIKLDTAKEYSQNLYRHFKVKNRNELLARFFIGEGKDSQCADRAARASDSPLRGG